MKNKTFEAYTLNELSEDNYSIMNFINRNKINTPKEELNETSPLKPNIWAEAYRSACTYFDRPNQDHRDRIQKLFRHNFSGLLGNTIEANSRKDLVLFVCKKQNEFLDSTSSPLRECNYDSLIKEYGINNERVESTYGSQLELKF